MIEHILLFIFIQMYWLCEGITEAFTWAGLTRREENPIVYSEWAKSNGRNVKGKFGYHAWRTLEIVGILGAIFTYPYVNSFWFFAGSSLIGGFVYQRMFGITKKGEFFPKKSPYRIGDLITVQHEIWMDWIFLIVGVGIIIWSLR